MLSGSECLCTSVHLCKAGDPCSISLNSLGEVGPNVKIIVANRGSFCDQTMRGQTLTMSVSLEIQYSYSVLAATRSAILRTTILRND